MNPTDIVRGIFHKALEILNLYNLYAEIRFNYHRDNIIKIPKSSKRNLVDLKRIKRDSKSLLIVVPSFYVKNWIPAESNFYFEMFQSAKEKHPDWKIEVFFCQPEKEWHKSLKEALIKNKPDILLMSSEIDPNEKSDWTLDVFIGNLSRVWNGTICYLLFDSAFPLHMWRLKRLIRTYPNCIIVAIDRDLNDEEDLSALCIGPIFLPISQKSILILRELIDAKIKRELLQPIHFSFIGQVYPYRKKILDRIEEAIPSLVVNPQKKMQDPNSYTSYMTALSLSAYTLNLSRQHVIKRNQLKCRVLEAALTGSHIISDEREYSGKFLEINDTSFTLS